MAEGKGSKFVIPMPNDWQYGRFDIRTKLPHGQGIWPAIWMLPTDDRYGSWASNGEIDIMEYKGQEIKKLHTTEVDFVRVFR